MASDLSKIIEDGICSTLYGSLAKNATLKETTKVHQKDLANQETVQIESTFEFDNITSTWAFIVPATTASKIFNIQMMMEDDPIVDTIDVDTTDAMKEFISTLSGGLVTSFNGSGYEELGQSKHSIISSEVIQGDSYDDTEHMYRFHIDLDEEPLDIFILFDNIILPYIEKISQSTQTVYEEETVSDEVIEDIQIENIEVDVASNETKETDNPNIENEDNTNQDNSKLENNSSNDSENNKESDENSEEELSEEDKKNKKLKMIVIATAALLGLTIIAGVAMYFMGMFEPEVIEKKEDNSTSTTVTTKDNLSITKYSDPNKINFNIDMINVTRVNAMLESLTKFEQMSPEDAMREKAKEKLRLKNLAYEEELKQFAKENKEEDIFSQKNIVGEKQISVKTTQNTTLQASTNTQKSNTVQKAISQNSSQYITLDNLEYVKYKTIIQKSGSTTARISICRYLNNTVIYIGPLIENDENNIKLIKLMNQEFNYNLKLEDISKEEFKRRCSFQ